MSSFEQDPHLQNPANPEQQPEPEIGKLPEDVQQVFSGDVEMFRTGVDAAGEEDMYATTEAGWHVDRVLGKGDNYRGAVIDTDDQVIVFASKDENGKTIGKSVQVGGDYYKKLVELNSEDAEQENQPEEAEQLGEVAVESSVEIDGNENNEETSEEEQEPAAERDPNIDMMLESTAHRLENIAADLDDQLEGRSSRIGDYIRMMQVELNEAESMAMSNPQQASEILERLMPSVHALQSEVMSMGAQNHELDAQIEHIGSDFVTNQESIDQEKALPDQHTIQSEITGMVSNLRAINDELQLPANAVSATLEEVEGFILRARHNPDMLRYAIQFVGEQLHSLMRVQNELRNTAGDSYSIKRKANDILAHLAEADNS